MSILTELMAAAATQLRISDEEVEAWLEATVASLEDEATDGDIRAIRQRQLDNPTRSSTPIHQQILRSHWHIDAIEKKARPFLVALLPKLFAIEVQNRRIDKLKQAQVDEREAARAANTTLHDDYRAFCDMLMRLGATPTKLGDLRQEEQAILADLIRWKIEDTGFDDPANPWRALYAEYSRRTMERGSQGKRAPPLSRPGAPPPDESGPRGRRFWRLDRAKGGVGEQSVATDGEAVPPETILPHTAPDAAPSSPPDASPPHVTSAVDHARSVVSSAAEKPRVSALWEDAAQLAEAHAKRLARLRRQADARSAADDPAVAVDAEARPPIPNLGARPTISELIKAARDGRRDDA